MPKSPVLRNKTSLCAGTTAATAKKSRSAGRPSHNEATDLREQLLDAAWVVFLEEGFGAARIEEIATRAGVSKTTVYRQFDTKEELFRSSVWRGMQNLRVMIEQTLNPQRGFSANLASLLDALNEYMMAPDTTRISRVVIGESHRFPDVAKRFLQSVNDLLEPVRRFIEDSARAGVIDVDDAANAARDLMTLVSGSTEVLLGIHLTRLQRKHRAERIHRTLLLAWKYRAPPP